MISVHDPDGTSTSRQATLYGAALVPVSLLPTLLGLMGGLYFGGALLLGLVYFAAAVAFAGSRSKERARRLLMASLLYFPGLLAVMLLDRILA